MKDGKQKMSQVTLRKHLEAYESTPNEWKQDHEEAMLCFDVQDSLEFGLLILEKITALDESLRLDGFEAKLTSEHFARMSREVEKLYHQWLMASLVHQEVIGNLGLKGYVVEGADQFRIAVDEVQKMMTPDKEFFAGSPLVALRDDALDAHARGETEEWSPGN